MPQLMYRAKKIELLHIDISTNLISQLKKNTLNCYQVNLDFTIQSRSIGGGGGWGGGLSWSYTPYSTFMEHVKN